MALKNDSFFAVISAFGTGKGGYFTVNAHTFRTSEQSIFSRAGGFGVTAREWKGCMDLEKPYLGAMTRMCQHIYGGLTGSEATSNYSKRIHDSFKTAFIAFLSSRIICGIFVYMAHARREYLSPVPGGWEGVKHWWVNPWTTYDSQWFLSIAKEGYLEHTTPFFPLYSFILKLGGTTESGMAIAGFLISNICLFISLYVLYLLTETDYGVKTAKVAVFLLAFFPTTVFFSAVYTESLFLVLLLSSFYLARRHLWLLAGGFGFFAALTRNPGVLIFLALILEYLKSVDYKWKELKISGLLGTSLPLFGFAAVQVHFWAKFGNPFAGIASQEFYFRRAGWPWEAIWKDFFVLLHTVDLITFLNLFITILVFMLILDHNRTIRPSYFVLLIGIIMMHLLYPRSIPPHTIGSVRYMSTTFPFIQLLGLSLVQLSSKPILYHAATATYISICLIFSYLFGAKVFLG